MQAPLVCLNGEWLPFSEARLPIYDLGLMQGATVTERLRTVRHQPYLVDEHLHRLEQSLALVGWNPHVSRGELADIITGVAQRNATLIPAEADLSIVLFVTAGQVPGESNGLISQSRPTWCVSSAPLPLRKWGVQFQNGVHLAIPQTRSLPATVIDPHIKMRSRLHWLIAEQEAREINPEAAALLLDQQGFLTETSTGNLFVVSHGELCTPRADTTLLGISQAQVIRLAGELEIPVTRRDLDVDALLQADEAFLTSSTYCLLPVSRVNQLAIGTGVPGPITRRLMQQWSSEIGLDFEQQALQALQSDSVVV